MITARPGALVVVAGLLLSAGGCAADDATPAVEDTAATSTSAPPAATATSEPAATQEPDVGSLEVTVTGGEVSPPPQQVDLAVGETLRLVITSDADTEVHAHGFEIQEDVPAGTPMTVELTGTAPGVYEVELHHPDLLLLQVAVR